MVNIAKANKFDTITLASLVEKIKLFLKYSHKIYLCRFGK